MTLSAARLCIVEWWDDRLMTIGKGFERKRFYPNRKQYVAFVWSDSVKPSKTLFRVADVPVEIRTENLPKTSSDS
jgi:hypothetical protein